MSEELTKVEGLIIAFSKVLASNHHSEMDVKASFIVIRDEVRNETLKEVERTKHNLLSFLETVFPELDEMKTSETDKSVMEIIKSYIEELEKELKP